MTKLTGVNPKPEQSVPRSHFASFCNFGPSVAFAESTQEPVSLLDEIVIRNFFLILPFVRDDCILRNVLSDEFFEGEVFRM